MSESIRNSAAEVTLQGLLADNQITLEVRAYRQTSSTNDECFALAAAGAQQPVAICADLQTKGRGRRGNRWEAKPGQSALLSLLLPGRDLSVETLSLAAGLAVADSVALFTGQIPELKWPNDVLVDGRKLAGVLIETRTNVKNPALTDYVIGVGMNVSQTQHDFSHELADRAIALSTICHHSRDIASVIVVLIKNLQQWCDPLAPVEKMVPLWRSRCRMLGGPIRVSCAGQMIEGTVADIDPMEGLIIRDYHGMNHACLASQTTVLQESPRPN